MRCAIRQEWNCDAIISRREEIRNDFVLIGLINMRVLSKFFERIKAHCSVNSGKKINAFFSLTKRNSCVLGRANKQIS